MSKSVELKPIRRMIYSFRIIGNSQLVQHQWSSKALKQMEDKKAGKKTKNRDVCDPQAEAEDATYRTEDGDFGIPVTALKSSIISAAHKDIGIEKTLVRKALFIRCADPGGVLKMDCSEPITRQDPVRVGQGTDLRYRPCFHEWAVDVECEVNADLLTTGDLLNLVNLAGFGVGIGEHRPEKGGDWGRFEIDRTQPIAESEVE